MTENSGCIKSRKIGNTTTEICMPSEGFGIGDKDIEKSEAEKESVNDEEDPVTMRISSLLDIGHRTNKVSFYY